MLRTVLAGYTLGRLRIRVNYTILADEIGALFVADLPSRETILSHIDLYTS